MDNLVTIGGECFEAEFRRKEVPADRDGVYYLFRLKDLTQKKRGELLISLFRFGPDKLLIPDYESRIEAIRLNFIRRAFDAGTISFDQPNKPHEYQTLSLKSEAFEARPPVSEKEIRKYVLHKAYWLGYRLGSVAKRMLVQFDVSFDLDYLGVTSDDVRRLVWLLSEQGFLTKTEFPGIGNATAKLIQAYESNRIEAILETADDAPAPTLQQLDELLGIPLRGQLEQDLLKFSAADNDGSPFSVLFVDLDKFKPVNDTYGHEMGDEVLKKITSVIIPICRGKGRFYRRSGDEFVVVLPNYNLREAEAIAERLREAVSQTSFDNCPESVTASIGVASYPETTQEFNLLLKDADKAMYEVKGSGGNGVSVFERTESKTSTRAAPNPKPVRSDIASRVEAAELWMSLEQGAYPSFIIRIENKSDENVTIESIALKYGNVYLCPPTKPSKSEELELPSRSKKHLSSWTPSTSPTSTLRMKLPDLQDGRIIEIDLVLVGIILGRKRTFSQSILVTVNYSNRNIVQYGG
jgi:diguanylate cyclase (GGDEF)-like protein